MLLPLAGVSVGVGAATPLPPPPTQWVCAPDGVHTWRLSFDAAGAPWQVSASIAAGTRECDLVSAAAPQAQPDGTWRFEWKESARGQRQRLDVRRNAAGGFELTLDPPACGALKLPASALLSPKGKGCAVSVDRDGAFEQFWRQWRDAVAREDGELLQQLSLPKLEFVSGPDRVMAPSSVMRRAARCIGDVPAAVRAGATLRSLMAGDTPPRLDLPPLSRRGDDAIDVAGAMGLKWTPRGWRMDGFNAEPEVFAQCR